MKLIFLNPKVLKLPIATMHKTGSLGFNAACSELMQLGKYPFLRIAIDGTPDSFNHFYLVPSQEQDKSAVKVNANGNYYNIKFSNILSEFGQTVKKFKVIKEYYDTNEVFKLVRLN